MPTRKDRPAGRRRTGAAAPQVHIKRVYDEALAADGRRVLVDRLWPRGIAKAAIGEWRPDLAPSHDLRRWYAHVPERFAEFAKRYRAELAGSGEAIAALREGARERPLTLLTATRELDLSHVEVLRRLIASRSRTPR
jgi:uncharacterized protein YeaO (DUF488 family)